MKIISDGIRNGIIDDKYGKRGAQIENGLCTYSLPVSITEKPAGTVCFALVLDDKDAVPVCGFTWIHWLACGITESTLGENASVTAKFPQGLSSSCGALGQLTKAQASRYEGMAPPDKPHRYDLTVYALDTDPRLENGFRYNELWYAMKDHILASATITGIYNN